MNFLYLGNVIVNMDVVISVYFDDEQQKCALKFVDGTQIVYTDEQTEYYILQEWRARLSDNKSEK